MNGTIMAMRAANLCGQGGQANSVCAKMMKLAPNSLVQ